MGFEYIRSVHGLLSLGLILLSTAALFAGYFVWNAGSVYFLFVLNDRILVTLVLLLIVLCWCVTISILAAQVLGKDLLEQLGKVKVIVIHGLCALFILGAAVCECYYLSSVPEDFYYGRMIAVCVCCFLMLLGYIGQIVFVVMQ